MSKIILEKYITIGLCCEDGTMSRKSNREEFIFTRVSEQNKAFSPVSAVFPATASEPRTYSLPADVTTIGYLGRGTAVISATGSDFKVAAKETFIIEKIASAGVEIKISADAVISWFSCSGSLPEALTAAYTTPTVAVRHLDISGIMQKIMELLIVTEGIIDEPREKALSAYFFEAVSEFYYSSDPINETSSKKKLSEAERIRIYIDNMIYSNPSLDDVKDHFGITKMHAIRVFKAKYKQTPMQYAIEHRTEVASTLLSTTDLPIKTISEMLHYSNTQHFSNSFKKIVGQSPNQYRQNAKKK